MSVSIQRLLEAQSVNVDFSGAGLSSEYMVVLNHLWNERFDTAAEHASTILAEEDDHPATARLYRAWIEALAEMDDVDSLNALQDHLFAIGRADPEMRQTYLALRGVIHLYLDQAPAARQVLRAIQGREHNPYCLEFEQMCARRGFEGAEEFAIATSNVVINDWFHWNTLTADLATFGSANDLHDVLQFVNRSFPGSPLMDLSNMHRAMDSGFWPGALASATKLRENFPDHGDYGFFAAFCANQNGDARLAMSILRSLGESANSLDPDVLHLTGEILAANALESDNESMAEQATQKLDTAARFYRRAGKPIDTAIGLMQRLEKQLLSGGTVSNETNGFRVPRNWLVSLSPAQYATIATSGDQDIGVLHRPMGSSAMPSL